MPYKIDADPDLGNPDAAMSLVVSEALSTEVYSAILYKGYSTFDYQTYPSLSISITGSAEKLYDGFIVITGDCTITIS